METNNAPEEIARPISWFEDVKLALKMHDLTKAARDDFFAQLDSLVAEFQSTAAEAIPKQDHFASKAKHLLGPLVIDKDSDAVIAARGQIAEILKTLTESGEMGRVAQKNTETAGNQTPYLPESTLPQSPNFADLLKATLARAIHKALQARHINGHIEVGARKAVSTGVESAFTNRITNPARQVRTALEDHFAEQAIPNQEKIIAEIMANPEVTKLFAIATDTEQTLNATLSGIPQSEFSPENLTNAAKFTTLSLLMARNPGEISDNNLFQILLDSGIPPQPATTNNFTYEPDNLYFLPALPAAKLNEPLEPDTETPPRSIDRLIERGNASEPKVETQRAAYLDAVDEEIIASRLTETEEAEVRRLKQVLASQEEEITSLEVAIVELTNAIGAIKSEKNGAKIYTDSEVNGLNLSRRRTRMETDREYDAKQVAITEKIASIYKELETSNRSRDEKIAQLQIRVDAKKQALLEAQNHFANCKVALTKATSDLEAKTAASKNERETAQLRLAATIEILGNTIANIVIGKLLSAIKEMDNPPVITDGLLTRISTVGSDCTGDLQRMAARAKADYPMEKPNAEKWTKEVITARLMVRLPEFQQELTANGVIQKIAKTLYSTTSRSPRTPHIRLAHSPADRQLDEVDN